MNRDNNPNRTDDIANAVLSWMVKHNLLDARGEYYASDVLAVLDDLIEPSCMQAAGSVSENRDD